MEGHEWKGGGGDMSCLSVWEKSVSYPHKPTHLSMERKKPDSLLCELVRLNTGMWSISKREQSWAELHTSPT